MERLDDLPEMVLVRTAARNGGDHSRPITRGGAGGRGRRFSSQRSISGNQDRPIQEGPLSSSSSNAKCDVLSVPEAHINNQLRDNTIDPVNTKSKVKSILSDITKENFDLMSGQLLEIPLLSYDALITMIDEIYEKAIDEPSLSELYADLCTRLSPIASDNKFVHIV
jgi:hypothetical protein